MPGQKITQKQIGLYMTHRKKGYSQAASAAKAGFCERSARNIEKRGGKAAQKKRRWRTRPDPFGDVWGKELAPMLQKEPKLQARTLLDLLQNKYEGKYPGNKLRTLERRVREWRAKYGPEKEVIFRQNHPPGRQGLSDFTCANSLKVMINGKAFDHILYHFRLAFSGWEYASVILGGESFTALSEHLQNALWQCGGAPATHRTDSLSAAFKNLSSKAKEDLTADYEEMSAHYGMEPTRNNKGKSQENGTIESSHRHLKNRLNQSLLLRGSRDFESLEEYRQLVRETVERHNRRIHKSYLEELAHLTSLPEAKTTDYSEERVKVTNSSTIRVKSIIYSVPSRLIGMTMKVHLYDDRLECFLGGDLVLRQERQRRGKHHVSQIDYRHLIGQLSQKPGAFANYIYKEACFPTLAFRQAYEYLEDKHGTRRACHEYVGILKLASQGDRERTINAYLESSLSKDIPPTAEAVRGLFESPKTTLPEIGEIGGDLESYNALLGGSL